MVPPRSHPGSGINGARRGRSLPVPPGFSSHAEIAFPASSGPSMVQFPYCALGRLAHHSVPSRGAPRIFSRGGHEQKFAYIVASRVPNINLKQAHYHAASFLGPPT